MTTLEKYLLLEMKLLSLPENEAETIRCRMDTLWRELSKEDHDYLDRRVIGQTIRREIEIPASEVFFE